MRWFPFSSQRSTCWWVRWPWTLSTGSEIIESNSFDESYEAFTSHCFPLHSKRSTASIRRTHRAKCVIFCSYKVHAVKLLRRLYEFTGRLPVVVCQCIQSDRDDLGQTKWKWAPEWIVTMPLWWVKELHKICQIWRTMKTLVGAAARKGNRVEDVQEIDEL